MKPLDKSLTGDNALSNATAKLIKDTDSMIESMKNQSRSLIEGEKMSMQNPPPQDFPLYSDIKTNHPSVLTTSAPSHGIPRAYLPLYHFFHGRLTPEDISRFSHLRVEKNSFNAQYLMDNNGMTIPKQSEVVCLWQFAETAMVNSIHINPPLVDFTIEELRPTRMAARRVAIVAYSNGKAFISLVHLLTGQVSKDDPIHEILRNER